MTGRHFEGRDISTFITQIQIVRFLDRFTFSVVKYLIRSGRYIHKYIEQVCLQFEGQGKAF